MRQKKMLLAAGVLLSASVALAGVTPPAGNIDPYNDESQYAYGENVGWLNFEPNQGPGVTVSDTALTGYVWAENIGWINLSPSYGGVVNDGAGLLSGYAWGENVGWIDFNPKLPDDLTHYGVIIDHDGNFSGWAYGENIGWINFNSAQLYGYGVRACVVNFHDLAAFAAGWLIYDHDPMGGPEIYGVNFGDYAAFAQYWREFCPEGWRFK